MNVSLVSSVDDSYVIHDSPSIVRINRRPARKQPFLVQTVNVVHTDTFV